MFGNHSRHGGTLYYEKVGSLRGVSQKKSVTFVGLGATVGFDGFIKVEGTDGYMIRIDGNFNPFAVDHGQQTPPAVQQEVVPTAATPERFGLTLWAVGGAKLAQMCTLSTLRNYGHALQVTNSCSCAESTLNDGVPFVTEKK